MSAPAWTMPSPFGGPDIPYFVANPVPTKPEDGCELVASRLCNGRGKERYHKLRVNLFRNKDGQMFTSAEIAREIEGSLAGVRVWFSIVPTHEIERTRWMDHETRRIYNDYARGQKSLFE